MAELDLVQDYVTKARTLLQDTIVPYRYADTDLVGALNQAMIETRRVRPDLLMAYLNTSIPNFAANDATPVPMDQQYRMSLVFYVVGYTQLRDDENVQDNRGMQFIGRFFKQMTSIEA